MPDSRPQYSIAQARNQLAQLIHQAEQGTPIEVTRRGKRVAIILSAEDFDRLAAHRGTFGKSLAAFRQHWDIESLDLDPDQVFQQGRDRSSGREVTL